MTEAQQANVDLIMDSQYQAKRSVVTNKQWVDMRNGSAESCHGCHVCAYCHIPDDRRDKPRLYMCHWAEPGSDIVGGKLIVYQAVNL